MAQKVKTAETFGNMRSARLLGIAGICIIGLYLVVNSFLTYAAVSPADFNVRNVAQLKQEWDLYMAALVGPLIIAFIIPTLYHFYLALKPAGTWFSIPPVVIYMFAYVIAAAYHISIAFVLLIAKELPKGTPFPHVYSNLFHGLQSWFSGSILLGSFWIFATFFFRKTHYPKWILRVNPLFMLAFFRFIPFKLPPKFAGFVYPWSVHLSIVTFMILSTILLWNNKEMDMTPEQIAQRELDEDIAEEMKQLPIEE